MLQKTQKIYRALALVLIFSTVLGLFPVMAGASSAGTIADNGRSLSLDGEIFINQYAKISGFAGVDVAANGGLLVWRTAVAEDDAVFGTQDELVEGLKALTGEYMAQTPGIAPKEYADELYLRIYVRDNDGNYVYGPLKEYSVQQYALNQLNKATAKVTLKNVCAAMLHYGAAAQANFNYNTDDLANAGIEANWPADEWNANLITALDEVNTTIVSTNDVTDNGKSLSLDGAIIVNFYFKAATTFTVDTAEILVWNGVTETLTEDNVSYTAELKDLGSEYMAQTKGIAAKEYSDTIFACAKFTDTNGNVHYSDVVNYSPEHYASRQIEKNQKPNLVALVKAMVTYGEYARTYFTNYYLTQNGTAGAQIVLPREADDLEAFAAQELQDHVKLVSGTTLPIIEETVEGSSLDVNFSPNVISPSEKGYFPVEFALQNGTNRNRKLTLRQVSDGETEPTITIRGDSANDGEISLAANASVVVTGMVTVEDVNAYGLCDIDVEISENGTVVETVSIPISARGKYTFENGAEGWIGGSIDGTQAKTGSQSLRIAGNTDAVHSSQIVLRNGYLYHLGFWARADVTDAQVHAKVTDYDADGNELAVPMSLYTRNDLSNGAWTYHEFRFIANPSGDTNYSHSNLCLEIASSGNVYLDDIRLADCDVKPVNTINSFADSDFEDGDISAWYEKTYRELATDTAYSGTNSMWLKGWNGAAVSTPLIKEDISDCMTVSFWMKGKAGDQLDLQLKYWNNSDGTTKVGEIFSFSITDQWERYEFTYERPEEARYLYLSFTNSAATCDYYTTRMDLISFYDTAAAQEFSEYSPADLSEFSSSRYTFENGVQGWTGGTAYQSNSNTGTTGVNGIEYTFENGVEGWSGGVIKQIDDTKALRLKNNTETVLRRQMELSSGNLYRLGFWAKSEGSDAVIYAKVADFDKDGNALPVPMSVFSKTEVTSGDWTYHEFRFVLNPTDDNNYCYSVLSLQGTADGYVYVDNISLVDCAVQPETTINHDADGDFEKGKTGWTGSDFINLDTDSVYSGANSIWLKGWKGSLIGTSGHLKACESDTVTLSFWMKGTAGDQFDVEFLYYNSTFAKPSDRIQDQVFPITIPVSGRWERYEITYKKAAEADLVYMKIHANEYNDYDSTRLDLVTCYDSSAADDLGDNIPEMQQKPGGTGSMQISGSQEAVLDKQLKLQSGRLYQMSFWTKSDTADAKLYAKITDQDAAGNTLSTPMSLYSRADVTNGDWTYHEFRFIANTTGDTGYYSSVLSLEAESAGSIYVDDVTVFGCGTTPMDALAAVADGDFESASISNWVTRTTRALVTDTAYTGKYSLRLNTSGNTTTTLNVPMERGVTDMMTVSFWMKGRDGDQLNLELQYTGENGNVVDKVYPFTITDRWERYEFTYEKAEAASQIYLSVTRNSETCSANTTRLDHITFYDSSAAWDLRGYVPEEPEPTGDSDGEVEDSVPEEEDVPLGAMPAIPAPANTALTIFIATPESHPELSTMFADDLSFLGDSDGFAIRQRGGTLYIFGANARGALNGVYDFIEENMGVLWIRADDIAYDAMSSVLPNVINYREKSPFSIRGLHLSGMGRDGIGHSDSATEMLMTRNKLNTKLAENQNITKWNWQRSIGLTPLHGGHNVGEWIRSSPIYDAAETEYWCTDENGNVVSEYDPWDPIRYEVNYFSELTAQTVAQSVIKFLDNHPGTMQVGVGPHDTDYTMCLPWSEQPFEYEEGKYVYPEDANYMSTVFYTFINRVAAQVREVYPDVLIRTTAYHHAEPAPECQLADNILVTFAPINENLNAPLDTTKEDPNNTILQNITNWKQQTTNLMFYNYYGCYVASKEYERPIWDKMQDDIQYYAQQGFAGVTPESTVDYGTSEATWAMNTLTFWILNKLMWNPYEDVDALKKEFCNKVYGTKAGAYMLEYYNLLQQGWDRDNGTQVVHYTQPTADYLAWFVADTGLVDDMTTALNNAWNAADETQRGRISYIKETFEQVVLGQ